MAQPKELRNTNIAQAEIAAKELRDRRARDYVTENKVRADIAFTKALHKAGTNCDVLASSEERQDAKFIRQAIDAFNEVVKHLEDALIHTKRADVALDPENPDRDKVSDKVWPI